METSVRLVKYFDTYVGLPSVLYDTDVRRRTLYGKAGAFRLQPWGVECRMLSAAMYANDKLMKIVWNGVLQAIEAFNLNKMLPDSTYVQKAIDNSDIDLAKKLIDKYDIRIIEG